MQTLNQNGYTDSEILEVLQFFSGTRQITYRYEQLDVLNNKIADLENVLDCSISTSFLDDVKRTAEFTILDDGSINFASDRIKPWARVAMPADNRGYAGVAASHNGIITGEYTFNESVTGAGSVVNHGIGGSAFNATIGGSGVKLSQSGIAEGSSFFFPAVTGAANQVTIPAGARFMANPSGTGGFTVLGDWSFTMFVNLTTTATFGRIWQDNSGWLEANNTQIHFTYSTTASHVIGPTIANPYGKDLRMITITRKLGIGTQIYLNGVPQIAASSLFNLDGDPTNPLSVAANTVIFGGDANISGYYDSPTWYNVALTDAEVLELWRAGMKTAQFGSANYAEWAQGVFLLSAPTRTEDDNKVITRKVQGYSGEQQFVDDVVTSRYTALAGTTYINNILGLVLSYIPLNLGIEDPTYWHNVSNNSSFSGTGATLTVNGPTVSGGLNNYATVQTFTIANADIRENFTLPASGAGGRGIHMEAGSDSGDEVQVDIVFQSGQWWFAYGHNGSYVIAPGTLLYSASSMAWLRIWENQGVIYIQTSPDNATWTTQGFIPSWSYLNKVAFGPFLTTSLTESAWSVTYNAFTVSASPSQAVNLSPSTAFITVAKEYDPGTTKLAIINDLLSQLNYLPLYYDDNGNPQIRVYVNPSTRPPEYVYANDDTSVTLPAKAETFDLYGVANVWVLVASNPDSTLYTATVTNDNPASPSSTVSRGREIVHYELESDATDLVTLQQKAAALASAASQVYDEIDFTTAVMPFHSLNDLYGLAYTDIGAFDKFLEIKWSYQLKQGATMTHSARRQVQL